MKPRNLLIARAVTEQGLTHTEAATKYGVTRQWVHTLVTRYLTQGPAGIEPRSKAPHTRPGTTPPAIRERIIELRHHLTNTGADAGPATIAWHLERDGHRVPAISTIRRILHTAGLITPAPKKRPRSSYMRFEADLPNECWQADITHWHLAHGTRVEILDFLDDHARYLLDITAAATFTGPMVADTLHRLIDHYGPPMSTLTDNGLVFTTRFARYRGSKGGFEKVLDIHGIMQKNGRPGHPQTQGKIERFHQTLKRYLAAKPRPHSIEALNTLLTEFQHWYNTERPHRALRNRTPEQAYTELPKATPTGTTDTEWRSRTDRVDKHGAVTLRYAGKLRHLGVGRTNKGKPVLMLIHDRDVTISDLDTGEILGEYLIDPDKNYQPKQASS